MLDIFQRNNNEHLIIICKSRPGIKGNLKLTFAFTFSSLVDPCPNFLQWSNPNPRFQCESELLDHLRGSLDLPVSGEERNKTIACTKFE